jgi:hypothetical protein
MELVENGESRGGVWSFVSSGEPAGPHQLDFMWTRRIRGLAATEVDQNIVNAIRMEGHKARLRWFWRRAARQRTMAELHP